MCLTAVVSVSVCALQVILSLTNNWNSTGSVDQFVSWSPTASTHEDFFQDDNCKQLYKQYAAAIVNRVNYLNGRRSVSFTWYNCASRMTGSYMDLDALTRALLLT